MIKDKEMRRSGGSLRQELYILAVFFILYSFAYLERYSITTIFYTSLNGRSEEVWGLAATYTVYGLGNLLNGRLADRLGGQNSVLIGAGFSFMLNFLAAIVENTWCILALWLINGMLQSFLWMGGVLLIKEYFKNQRYGIGTGIINSASGVAQILTFSLPGFALVTSPQSLAVLLPALAAAFFISDPRDSRRRREQNTGAAAPAAPNQIRNFFLWCGVAFLSSLCRYGIISWIPVYYASSLQEAVEADHTGEIVLSVGMAAGTLVLCVLTERFFRENRAVVTAAMAAACAMLIAVLPSQTQLGTILTCVFFAGFFLYGINGVLWLTALDNSRTGHFAGIFNGAAYMGAVCEEVLSQLVFSQTESRFLVFFFMEGICVVMLILSVCICRKNTIIIDTRAR